jgi:hypothetical protein
MMKYDVRLNFEASISINIEANTPKEALAEAKKMLKNRTINKDDIYINDTSVSGYHIYNINEDLVLEY